jgi:cytochrome c oxidase cbb3-type subunit III
MKRMMLGMMLIFAAGGQYGIASAQESGAALYKAYCAQCHGIHGDGMGINVRDMTVQPRDHTDASWMSGRSDEELFKAVKEGGLALSKSVLMPPWEGVIDDDGIHRLVEYMRELCGCTHGSGS